MKKKLVPIAAGLVVLVVTAGAAIVALEVGLRVKEKFPSISRTPAPTGSAGVPGPEIDHHPYLLTYSRPNQHSGNMNTNSAGFRDTREFPFKKEPGVRRIALTGGSTAVGFLASNDSTTIAGRLEELLNANSSKWRYEVMNASASALQSHQELILLALEVLPRQPDIVVSFSGGTDFYASLDPNWRRNYSEALPVLEASLNHSWTKHLRLTEFLKQKFKKPAGSHQPVFHPEALEHYARNVSYMANLVTGTGARFLSVLQPNIVISTKKLTAREIAGEKSVGALPGHIGGYNEIMGKLYEGARKQMASVRLPKGAAFLDASDMFGRAEPKDELFQDTVHLTDEGYRRAAVMIRDELTRLGYLN